MSNPYLDEFEDGRRDFRLTAAMMDFGSEVFGGYFSKLVIDVVRDEGLLDFGQNKKIFASGARE